MSSINPQDYTLFLKEVKSKVQISQTKAVLAVNRELIAFYWELGRMIVEKQQRSKWGDKVITKLSADLRSAFPSVTGLSTTNLKYCKRFYEFYASAIGQRSVDQLQLALESIPWGHHIAIFTKTANVEEANFYLQETLENQWSRDVLALQIKSNLYQRQSKALTNFTTTLPDPQSELAQQTFKDPYIFDFLTLSKPYKERDIEDQLVQHITKFLLELGKGFAFIGRQYPLRVGKKEYFLDLLFYHVQLNCYIVIDLKNTEFTPEYAGKMNFYLSAVDSLMKKETDQPTIGILLCRDKDSIEVEFALRDINKPMGVSEFQFTEILPDNLRSSLPTIEEIEEGLQEEE